MGFRLIDRSRSISLNKEVSKIAGNISEVSLFNTNFQYIGASRLGPQANYEKDDKIVASVPVTVVAKDKDSKTSKTLDAKDFTVRYEYKNNGSNVFDTNILTKVTITNTNYIYGSADATKSAELTATAETTIKAKALTDSMVVANPATYTYTGGKITPTYYVMDGQTVLYKEGDVETGAEYKEVSITDAVCIAAGRPKSPASRIDCTIGISPKKGTPKSSERFLAPSFPKI